MSADATPQMAVRCVILMGVAGSGKSTLGEALAARGLFRFVDGDDLHPPANVAKMTAGGALTDADRAPWLAEVGRVLATSQGPIAVGCSALRRRYRDAIRAAAGEAVLFVHLSADQTLIANRMASRAGHFMPVTLLDSQFATLEPLQPDELGVILDITNTAEQVAAAAEALLLAPPP